MGGSGGGDSKHNLVLGVRKEYTLNAVYNAYHSLMGFVFRICKCLLNGSSVKKAAAAEKVMKPLSILSRSIVFAHIYTQLKLTTRL